MTVVFHLTDRCNLYCEGCHWFSSKIKIVPETDWTHYNNWISRHSVTTIYLSGGEPTLYPDLLPLIHSIPETIMVIINTNGTMPLVLSKIKRKKLQLRVSENRPLNNPDFEKKIMDLGFPCNFYSFNGLGGKKNKENELESGKDLIGRKIFCTPAKIRFASDGHAYCCEMGIRTKQIEYRSGFSLWEGTPHRSGKNCVITEKCASNFKGENYIL